jgi:hypothetical protein
MIGHSVGISAFNPNFGASNESDLPTDVAARTRTVERIHRLRPVRALAVNILIPRGV